MLQRIVLNVFICHVLLVTLSLAVAHPFVVISLFFVANLTYFCGLCFQVSLWAGRRDDVDSDVHRAHVLSFVVNTCSLLLLCVLLLRKVVENGFGGLRYLVTFHNMTKQENYIKFFAMIRDSATVSSSRAIL